MIAAPLPPPVAPADPTLTRELFIRLNQTTQRPGNKKEGPLLPSDHLARVFGHPKPFSKEERETYKKLLAWRFNERQRCRASVRALEELEQLRRQKQLEREARYGKIKKSTQLRQSDSRRRQQGYGRYQEDSGSSSTDEECAVGGDGRGRASDVSGGDGALRGGVRYGTSSSSTVVSYWIAYSVRGEGSIPCGWTNSYIYRYCTQLRRLKTRCASEVLIRDTPLHG